ncbi:MAG: hypothetical protein ACO1OT_08900 [Heyndrickxia sp.]
MPCCRITIRYTVGSSRTCIRQHTAYDIEYYMEQLKKDNKSLFVTELEAVMVSKNAPDVKAYISSQVRKGNK